MAKEQPDKDEQQLALMKLEEAEAELFAKGEVFHLTGIGRHADYVRAQMEIHSVLAYKHVHDRKLYKPFRTWERYCALIGKSHTALLEAFQNLTALGEGLMRHALALKLPRESIRQLRQVNQPEFQEILAALESDEIDVSDARRLIHAAIDLAAEERSKCQLAEETVKRRDEDLAKRKETEHAEHEKRVEVEKQLRREVENYGRDPSWMELQGRVIRTLGALRNYVRTDGVRTEDVKEFKRGVDIFHTMIDDVWRDFIEPPKGMVSREDYKRCLMKEKGFTESQAEDILAETEL